MTAVVIAYGFIWAAIFGYLVMISRKTARLNAEMDELRRRLEKATE